MSAKNPQISVFMQPTVAKRTQKWIVANVPLARPALHWSRRLFGTLRSGLRFDGRPGSHISRRVDGRRPRICILADRREWAYDISARQLKRHLADEFDIVIRYVIEKPRLSAGEFDLLHVCFWGEDYYRPFGFDRERIIKQISSHRWQDDPRYGPCTPEEFAERYLSDCDTVICSSHRLATLVQNVFGRTFHAPNGVDTEQFGPTARSNHAETTFGWAGNAADPVKGFRELVVPACGDRFNLIAATGGVRHAKMVEFYRGVDVFVVSSRHEGEPLPLIEAMACGCFPVCVDVGIVPELIDHERNGYIVRERTVEAFRAAFEWCERNPQLVRTAGLANAAQIARTWNWPACADVFRRIYRDTLSRADRPRFRNDDVSWDTSLEDFRRFCAVFHQYGQSQIHGITLRGNTHVVYAHHGAEVEYEGFETIANLDNATIRRLSAGKNFEDRADLIDWLNAITDELALHGLYHTDYSIMSDQEQDRDIGEGLALMRTLFPGKRVRYFIAPFNRTNSATYSVARRHGLTVLAAEGVHLEEEIDRLVVRPGEWYRYHHHRFYPESRFSYYNLTIEKLDEALRRNFGAQLSETKRLSTRYSDDPNASVQVSSDDQ